MGSRALVDRRRATDESIMAWAREHAYVVVTHDLDSSALLAVTRAVGPSIIQVRTQDVLPRALRTVFINAIKQYSVASWKRGR